MLRGVVWAVCCMVLYGCMLIQRCMVLYVAVWLYGARREAGQGVAPVWSEIQLNTAKYSRIPYSRPYSKLGLYAHTAASRGVRRRYTAHSEHTEKTGGGLEPSAANPDYWDLVPYSENNRSISDPGCLPANVKAAHSSNFCATSRPSAPCLSTHERQRLRIARAIELPRKN